MHSADQGKVAAANGAALRLDHWSSTLSALSQQRLNAAIELSRIDNDALMRRCPAFALMKSDCPEPVRLRRLAGVALEDAADVVLGAVRVAVYDAAVTALKFVATEEEGHDPSSVSPMRSGGPFGAIRRHFPADIEGDRPRRAGN